MKTSIFENASVLLNLLRHCRVLLGITNAVFVLFSFFSL